PRDRDPPRVRGIELRPDRGDHGREPDRRAQTIFARPGRAGALRDESRTMSERERDPDDLSVEAKRARELLHRLEAPRPDGGFRARLKETFVGGGFVEAR